MSNRRSAFAAALSLALLLHPDVVPAQQAGSFGEVLEVGLTSVDVVAIDNAGNPVAGLKPEDFELFEDGKRQSITHFSETGSLSASALLLSGNATTIERPAAQDPRKFIFYIDDFSLSLANRRAIFPAVRKFLAENLRKGDQAMLVNWNRELKVRVPWTSDLKTLDSALETMAGELSSASQLQAEKQRAERLLTKMLEESNEPKNNLAPAWSELENAARSYAEVSKVNATQATNALARMLGSLTGVDGRKVLVLATESLPTIAGAELFEHLDNIRNEAVLSQASTLKRDAMRSSKIMDVNRYDVAPALEVLARAANSAGITIYGVNPKGLGGDASGKVEQQQPREMNLEFARSDQALAGINLLASRTGGTAMVGAPADVALDRVHRDLNAYYSLGYRSTAGANPERKIEVRAKRRGVQVRARTNVYHRSLEREMADRVIANHLQSDLANELGISLETDPVTSNGSQRLLPVRVVIPVNMLTLLPDASGNVTGGFSVFTCSSDGAGDTSGVNVQSHAIHFPPEQASQMKGRRIGFAIQVPMEKGRHHVSIGVVDHVSQSQGFATYKATL